MDGLDSTEMRLRGLMLASLDGDAPAYRALLSELSGYLRAYFGRRLRDAYAAHAEDLVQETLLAIHSKRLTYDRDRPFTAWMHAVAHHKFVDHVRRHGLRATVPLDDDAPVFARDDSGEAATRRDLDVVLGVIPERASTLIRKVKLEGASIAEAAASSGMSESAVKVAIHRGLKALTARFAGGRDDR